MIRELCNFPSQLTSEWKGQTLDLGPSNAIVGTPNHYPKLPFEGPSHLGQLRVRKRVGFISTPQCTCFLLYVCFRSSPCVKVAWAVTTIISISNFFWKTLFPFCLWVWLATSVLSRFKYMTGYL